MADEAPRRAKFPAKLFELASTCPDILRWSQSERTLIIEDRTRFSKTTGMKWSSFRRQLFRYGFYKHDWRTGVPGIVFANCDPRVVTIDDLAGLVRAAKPQMMREMTGAQLRRKNDKFRALLLENDKLRAAIRENLGSRADEVLREISAAVAAAEGPSRVVTDDDSQSMGASPPEEANAPATPRDTGHIDEDLSAPLYDAEELDVDLFDFDGSEDMSLL